MASKRETVLAAVTALIAAALPGAEVKRNPAKAERIPAGGFVAVRDGDPGKPEASLSPPIYVYSHRITIEIAAPGTTEISGEQALDAMAGAIGAALAADRMLGGLCDWIEAEAPVTGDIEAPGAAPVRFAELAVLAVYATSDPLN
jgi:hypothetical protein